MSPRQEGFDAIAHAFEMIAVAEKQHGKRYAHEGEEALEVCPACLHPQAHFELLVENW